MAQKEASHIKDQVWYDKKRREFENYVGKYWRAEADISEMYFTKYRTLEGDRKWLSIQNSRELGNNIGNSFTYFASEIYHQVGISYPRERAMFFLMTAAQENAHYAWLAQVWEQLFDEEMDRHEITASRAEHPWWEYERQIRRVDPSADRATKAGAMYVGGGGASIFYGMVAALAKIGIKDKADEIIDMASRNIVSDEIEHSVMEGAKETEEGCQTDEDWELAKASARESQIPRIRARMYQFSIPEEQWDDIIEKYDKGDGIEPLTTGGIGSITSVLYPKRQLAAEAYLAPA
jgi:hypothetical protein